MFIFIAGYGSVPLPLPQPARHSELDGFTTPTTPDTTQPFATQPEQPQEPGSAGDPVANCIYPDFAAGGRVAPSAAEPVAKDADLLESERPAPVSHNVPGADALAVANAGDFLSTTFPPREMVLAPILPSQGLAMLYSRRGVGKTYLSLGIAHAVARGGRFLRWFAPRPRRVLFVDGELPAPVLQQRLRTIVSGLPDSEPQLPGPDFFKIITPDLQYGAMPDICTARGQAMIESRLEGANLLVLDNLSCLMRSGKENEGESWIPVQDWALRLRQQGISVMFLHHAGKGGQQRGTSRREDLLDTVIALRQPENYCATEGLRAHVRFEKARGFFGEDARTFEVRMEIRNESAVWTMSVAEEEVEQLLNEAGELFDQGRPIREVAQRLGISKSRAGRLKETWDKA